MLKVWLCDHCLAMSRTGEPDISTVAASIGQPARAAMLSALLGGEPLAVTDLAARAAVTPATASLHLRRLADDGLVVGRRRGRTHRYELASRQVASALEALQQLAPPTPARSLGGANARAQLQFARSCYDHLAGQLGVAVTDALVEGGRLRRGRNEFEVTDSGVAWLEQIGIDVTALRESRRGFALQCVDWSERRPHVAGAVGAALLSHFLTEGWLRRRRGRRTLELTSRGADELRTQLAVDAAALARR
jgi:DNA-binding transcriptional ArsR family regulator